MGRLRAGRAESAAPAAMTIGLGEVAGWGGAEIRWRRQGCGSGNRGRKDVGTRLGCVWLGHDAD